MTVFPFRLRPRVRSSIDLKAGSRLPLRTVMEPSRCMTSEEVHGRKERTTKLWHRMAAAIERSRHGFYQASLEVGGPGRVSRERLHTQLEWPGHPTYRGDLHCSKST
jgi:hypothetical protein